MQGTNTIYPNLNWEQFAVFNDDRTGAFEDMCRDLFYCEYLHENRNPHADHNNPGVEVLPILEPIRDDGKPQRYISFQAKYFEQKISNSKIIESLNKVVEYFGGQLGRVYLFCNKVISEESDRFRKFQAILSPANIELELVTDRDIFVLLRKHKRIADYFFQDRKRTTIVTNNLIGNASVLSVATNAEVCDNSVSTVPLLQGFIEESLKRCKAAVCELEFGNLKAELKLLGAAAKENGKISYYQFLLAIQRRANAKNTITLIPNDLKKEALWLENLSRGPRSIAYDEIKDFSPETQIVALNVLFSEQCWDSIVEIYKYRCHINPDILKAFSFYYALSLFNLRREDEAHEVLEDLYKHYQEPRFELYDICARLNKANRTYACGDDNQNKVVKELLETLARVKEQATEQFRSNGIFIANIELQSCFNLGLSEKIYIDEAINRYNGYPESIKNSDIIRLAMSLCYEVSGDIEKARELLSQCAWRDEEELSARYLAVLVDSKQPDEAIKAFSEVKNKTPYTESVYLLALSRAECEDYEKALQEVVDKHSESIDDLSIYGFYTERSDVFRRVILPKIISLVEKGITDVKIQTKEGLLVALSRNGEFSLVEMVLNTIQELNTISVFVGHTIRDSLFSALKQKNGLQRQDSDEVNQEITLIEKIAKRFYESGALKRDFLQILLMCASVSHMDFSMLKYSKELFKYTHDVQTARNIIALLYERNETNKDEYAPYLEVLIRSEEPIISVAAAAALWKLGKYEEADFYIYKAIYNLDEEEDFDVYKAIFSYYNLNIQRNKEIPERKTVSGNMIVTLKAGEEIRVIALDSEADFGDANNHSLGANHIGKQNQIYNKLLGSGKKQVLSIKGQDYEVLGFEPREVAIARFIFQKVKENPARFDVHAISTENPENMMKELTALSDQREHTKELLDLYNFRDSELGIPVDYFVNGDYLKYIVAMKVLLYSENLAYYAGESRKKPNLDTKYVPTLSTLVLLAMHGWLNALDCFENNIVIPESYMDFFRTQYASELSAQSVSEGSLVTLESGGIAFFERDKEMPEIWEKIINKCESYSAVRVTEEERIAFEIADGYTWEMLFGGNKIDKMQLDGIIVAERENGVYLCDDLFFRKIAEIRKINNINFATLLYANEKLDDVMPIIMRLSETNYIYTPLMWRNQDEMKQLFGNLLKGEMKKKYYTEFFYSYIRNVPRRSDENPDKDGV